MNTYRFYYTDGSQEDKEFATDDEADEYGSHDHCIYWEKRTTFDE